MRECGKFGAIYGLDSGQQSVPHGSCDGRPRFAPTCKAISIHSKTLHSNL